MIEKQIVAEKLREKGIQDFVFSFLGKLSCSKIKLQRTPLGEKISIYTSKPGLIVGKRGANIRALTNALRTRFKLENPQIEVEEITNPYLDSSSVAKNLMSGFQRFGPKRFKAMAYRALDESMKAGATGMEIVISGRGVPGERSKTWRFSAGYLKKSGDIGENFMDKTTEGCNLKSGTVGIKVKILHPDVKLPDEIIFTDEIRKKEEAKAGTEAEQIKKAHEKKAEEKKEIQEEVKKKAEEKSVEEFKEIKEEEKPSPKEVATDEAVKEESKNDKTTEETQTTE